MTPIWGRGWLSSTSAGRMLDRGDSEGRQVWARIGCDRGAISSASVASRTELPGRSARPVYFLYHHAAELALQACLLSHNLPEKRRQHNINETSHCIGKKVGAYEMSGVILVGNIEEPLMTKLDLDRVVSGADIFSQLNYEQISSNIRNATASLGGLEKRL
jgi:hypothetical protein